MNRRNLILTPLAIFTLLLLTGCGDVGEGDSAETGEAVNVENSTGGTGEYAIDPATSEVAWVGANLTNSHDGGFKTFSGTVTVDAGSITHVKIDIDATSIFSDDEKLTGHLMSDEFFDVANHPAATFEASDFKALETGEATHQITGNLTLRGTTKSVSFPANVSMTDGGVSAEANFIINRQDWGVSYAGQPDNLISDDVRITFKINAAPTPAA